jgi:hypothetical protein
VSLPVIKAIPTPDVRNSVDCTDRVFWGVRPLVLTLEQRKLDAGRGTRSGP